MVKKAFLLVSILFLVAYTAFAEKASKYTISLGGGVPTEYTYTDWPALMTQVKTYTGTDAARVMVTITGNDFDESDNMPKVSNVNTIVCANDNVPYTTFKFENCTFSKSSTSEYDCISFGYAIAKGIVLEFHSCTLNERLYGNEAGTQAGDHYTVDVKFYNCTFTSQSIGGRWFGDVLFEGCTFNNLVSWDITEPMINTQNGNGSDCRRVNSVGAASTMIVKDCTFDQSITDASWLRFIYAVDFENYDIDLDYYFYPCLSDQFNFSNITGYNTDKLNTGKVQQLKINNNDQSSTKINFLAFLPARVKYEANAPESATVSGETQDDNLYEIGQDFTIKANGFTCNGYKFKGWNTHSRPTELDPGTTYTEGQTAQIPFSGKFIIYAQWEKVYDIIVKCIGLENGESATFSVEKKDDSTVRFNVLLTGTGSGPVTTTIINLAPGIYTVTERDWIWTYTPEGSTEKTQDITEEGGNVFTFTNAEKENIPLHDEAIKNNAIINAREGVTVNEWETEKRKIQF